MTSKGTSVIMSSSELPELLAIADRMLILHRGRLVGTLEGESMTQRDVLRLAVAGGGGDAAEDQPVPPLEQLTLRRLSARARAGRRDLRRDETRARHSGGPASRLEEEERYWP